jgi:hypothetical protein
MPSLRDSSHDRNKSWGCVRIRSLHPRLSNAVALRLNHSMRICNSATHSRVAPQSRTPESHRLVARRRHEIATGKVATATATRGPCAQDTPESQSDGICFPPTTWSLNQPREGESKALFGAAEFVLSTAITGTRCVAINTRGIFVGSGIWYTWSPGLATLKKAT